jgi:hypothetical protein
MAGRRSVTLQDPPPRIVSLRSASPGRSYFKHDRRRSRTMFLTRPLLSPGRWQREGNGHSDPTTTPLNPGTAASSIPLVLPRDPRTVVNSIASPNLLEETQVLFLLVVQPKPLHSLAVLCPTPSLPLHNDNHDYHRNHGNPHLHNDSRGGRTLHIGIRLAANCCLSPRGLHPPRTPEERLPEGLPRLLASPHNRRRHHRGAVQRTVRLDEHPGQRGLFPPGHHQRGRQDRGNGRVGRGAEIVRPMIPFQRPPGRS